MGIEFVWGEEKRERKRRREKRGEGREAEGREMGVGGGDLLASAEKGRLGVGGACLLKRQTTEVTTTPLTPVPRDQCPPLAFAAISHCVHTRLGASTG